MSKKILIDLNICRECGNCTCSCAYNLHPDNNGVQALLENAAFSMTCRRCESAPCVDVCPEKALYKEDDQMVHRATNLCVGCHSCIAACPFGTLLNEFFEYRKSICDYCGLNDSTESLLCVDTCPHDALSLVEAEESEEDHMYALGDKVLVKEYPWKVFAES